MIRFTHKIMNDDLIVSYDPEARAVYVRVKSGRVSKTKKQAPGVFVDLDSKGNLLGVEFLDPKHIEVNIIQRIARVFKFPGLKHLNPKAIPAVYACA